jgi:hypothetical protein
LLGISDPPTGLAFILCGLLERRKHMKTRIAISLLAVVAARMNTKTLKGIGATLALLAGMCVATLALATSTGEQGLGDEGRATGTQNPVDVYIIVCAHLAPPEGPQFPMLIGPRVRVYDSGPIVAHNHLAVVIMSRAGGKQVVDSSGPLIFRPEGSPFYVRQPDGDSPGPSEYAEGDAEGVGDPEFLGIEDQRYVAVVKKTGPEAEGYVMEAQCR